MNFSKLFNSEFFGLSRVCRNPKILQAKLSASFIEHCHGQFAWRKTAQGYFRSSFSRVNVRLEKVLLCF